ncbi:synaptic vesicular amine transporter-like [Hetaerina americana]|uniref:synaptic vesicular amine transporter-like n=1 Tax=Hetaerina americana TaxID=62018 RepID=UPI003A7F1C44
MVSSVRDELSTEQWNQSSRTLIFIVYISMFLDNILLTIVVPIIPEYLYNLEENFLGENGRVAILLSSKAVVQLVINPVVGVLMSRTGHQIPLFVGSLCLLLSSLLFAFARRYAWLLVARSLQGIASACIGVAGMCLVAERYPEEGGSRGKIMGVVLGATALGVLLGYPLGGLLYDFTGGKKTPFLVVAVLVSIDTVLQLLFLDLKPIPKRPVLSEASKNVPNLLRNWKVLVTIGAIWVSTSAMSILEPCLPIWLMDTIKPKRWQIGMVFIPDSLGYLLGTNFLGGFAFHIGRWKVATAAMLLVGVSAIMVASSTSMGQLIGPHFGIGLGIGAVDSALVPLLALLVECNLQNHNSGTIQKSSEGDEGVFAAQYATVYALQQTAVSLAYSLGPILGGELVYLVGFPWLMRTVGLLNILYCPLLMILQQREITNNSIPKGEDKETQNIIMSTTTSTNYRTGNNEQKSWIPSKLRFSSYHRFYDLDDSD